MTSSGGGVVITNWIFIVIIMGKGWLPLTETAMANTHIVVVVLDIIILVVIVFIITNKVNMIHIARL